MRKIALALSALAAVGLAAAPAAAKSRHHTRVYRAPPPATYAQADPRYPQTSYVVPLAGAAVGTAVGVGLYNGWYGSSATVAAFPTTAAGAATTGFIAGVGTVALLDAIIQPCKGFHAIFGAPGCRDGVYVGQ